eukprot:TRINITY_DN5991_c0_g1_i1.p1 TRINITY_DN5991_c0_g1~~TRINITY_DN5991_c0_g1_i1.p1  ORF type:complete len:266 (+),score=103.96 TRINITY_DN5991_c0_g1_i1:73-870(+)
MALSDQVTSLYLLREAGALTDQQFRDAKELTLQEAAAACDDGNVPGVMCGDGVRKGGLFSKAPEPTPREMVRQHQRTIRQSCRGLDREREKLAREEAKLKVNIKKEAKAQRMDVVRIMAKDMVRLRQNQAKMLRMKTRMESVSRELSVMASTAEMGKAMQGVGRVMGQMNRSMNLAGMQQVMMEFQREGQKMDMVGDMMGDAIDDAMGDDEAEADEMVDQVMEEITLELKAKIDVPAVAKEQLGQQQQEGDMDDLAARLSALRKE